MRIENKLNDRIRSRKYQERGKKRNEKRKFQMKIKKNSLKIFNSKNLKGKNDKKFSRNSN